MTEIGLFKPSSRPDHSDSLGTPSDSEWDLEPSEPHYTGRSSQMAFNLS